VVSQIEPLEKRLKSGEMTVWSVPWPKILPEEVICMVDACADLCDAVDVRTVTAHLHKLRTFVEAADYAGYDPYDALNSPVLRVLSSRSKWIRVACTQLLRRSPLNLRKVLAVRKGHNPKAIGLFLWGYARLYATEGRLEYRERIEYLLDLLEKLKSDGYSGNCWGYNFGWQNWKTWTPEYTPTIVNSAFIGHALLDTYFLDGVDRALQMAVEIKDFICCELKRHQEKDRLCFSYTPLDELYVHNANLLGASLLIRLYRICGDRLLEEMALASLRYGLHYQRHDGAWYYGQMRRMDYVDSFHTGFNLQALQYFIREGYGSFCHQQYDLGLKYYVEHFFLPGGCAKYYDDRIFPVDIHSLCQAVVVLSDPLADQTQLSAQVLRWMLQHMWNSKGYFHFRKGRFHVNRICYMRWSQAWAFHALTSFLYVQAHRPSEFALGPISHRRAID
jgi:hypothetical protein